MLLCFLILQYPCNSMSGSFPTLWVNRPTDMHGLRAYAPGDVVKPKLKAVLAPPTYQPQGSGLYALRRDCKVLLGSLPVSFQKACRAASLSTARA